MSSASPENGRVTVKLLFFAKSRELAGKKDDRLDVKQVITYEELLKIIVDTYALELIKNNVILAVNEELTTPGNLIKLKEDDEIAILPPLSGG